MEFNLITMSGAGAYFFRAIGAFIRWLLTGCKANYKEFFDGTRGDTEKGFMNDLLNIGVAVLFLAVVVIVIQLSFF